MCDRQMWGSHCLKSYSLISSDLPPEYHAGDGGRGEWGGEGSGWGGEGSGGEGSGEERGVGGVGGSGNGREREWAGERSERGITKCH